MNKVNPQKKTVLGGTCVMAFVDNKRAILRVFCKFIFLMFFYAPASIMFGFSLKYSSAAQVAAMIALGVCMAFLFDFYWKKWVY